MPTAGFLGSSARQEAHVRTRSEGRCRLLLKAKKFFRHPWHDPRAPRQPNPTAIFADGQQPVAGPVILRQLATRRSVLNIACNRCARRGRLRIPRLIAEHGADLPVPELRRIVASDCPRMMAEQMRDGCGVHFPGLAE